eukprot:NODE_368_length_1576_cov_93.504912_g273_i0.p1 GENE.NODE_368_length_1576_cov_93.504912_g273_i0~~NODE_368_length_1576_cov_93.504912_g273_i0.p1  ORF type:complete len:343 (-),score=117.68 NODE_368_length_1576_cov_93.504912_g273_i0:194-1222(-)
MLTLVNSPDGIEDSSFPNMFTLLMVFEGVVVFIDLLLLFLRTQCHPASFCGKVVGHFRSRFPSLELLPVVMMLPTSLQLGFDLATRTSDQLGPSAAAWLWTARLFLGVVLVSLAALMAFVFLALRASAVSFQPLATPGGAAAVASGPSPELAEPLIADAEGGGGGATKAPPAATLDRFIGWVDGMTVTSGKWRSERWRFKDRLGVLFAENGDRWRSFFLVDFAATAAVPILLGSNLMDCRVTWGAVTAISLAVLLLLALLKPRREENLTSQLGAAVQTINSALLLLMLLSDSGQSGWTTAVLWMSALGCVLQLLVKVVLCLMCCTSRPRIAKPLATDGKEMN